MILRGITATTPFNHVQHGLQAYFTAPLPQAEHWPTRNWRPLVKQPTSCSTNGSRRHLRLMPMTFSISGILRGTMIRHPVSRGIKTAVLAINSADDERNPPETGIMERELKRIRNARLFLIPASEDTVGHGTTFFAKYWKQEVQQLLQTSPRSQ